MSGRLLTPSRPSPRSVAGRFPASGATYPRASNLPCPKHRPSSELPPPAAAEGLLRATLGVLVVSTLLGLLTLAFVLQPPRSVSARTSEAGRLSGAEHSTGSLTWITTNQGELRQ